MWPIDDPAAAWGPVPDPDPQATPPMHPVKPTPKPRDGNFYFCYLCGDRLEEKAAHRSVREGGGGHYLLSTCLYCTNRWMPVFVLT